VWNGLALHAVWMAKLDVDGDAGMLLLAADRARTTLTFVS
jgi:hypothetical protein